MGDGERPDEKRIEGLASRPAGYDSEDPYENVDLAELPQWWRETVNEFREYGLRPYRPPRFQDGVLKHEVVEDLEADLDVKIRFVSYADDSDCWTVLVDETSVGEVGHHRAPDGFSVFEIDSDSFETLVIQRLPGSEEASPADDE